MQLKRRFYWWYYHCRLLQIYLDCWWRDITLLPADSVRLDVLRVYKRLWMDILMVYEDEDFSYQWWTICELHNIMYNERLPRNADAYSDYHMDADWRLRRNSE